MKPVNGQNAGGSKTARFSVHFARNTKTFFHRSLRINPQREEGASVLSTTLFLTFHKDIKQMDTNGLLLSYHQLFWTRMLFSVNIFPGRHSICTEFCVSRGRVEGPRNAAKRMGFRGQALTSEQLQSRDHTNGGKTQQYFSRQIGLVSECERVVSARRHIRSNQLWSRDTEARGCAVEYTVSVQNSWSKYRSC